MAYDFHHSVHTLARRKWRAAKTNPDCPNRASCLKQIFAQDLPALDCRQCEYRELVSRPGEQELYGACALLLTLFSKAKQAQWLDGDTLLAAVVYDTEMRSSRALFPRPVR